MLVGRFLREVANAPAWPLFPVLPFLTLALVMVPVEAATWVLSASPGVHATATAVELEWQPRLLLAAIAIVTIFCSVAIGGFARWAYQYQKSSAVLGLHLIALAISFIICAGLVRDIGAAFARPGEGDNALLVAFFALWLVMVGYVAKAPWDEARERVFRWIERKMQPAVGARPPEGREPGGT